MKLRRAVCFVVWLFSLCAAARADEFLLVDTSTITLRISPKPDGLLHTAILDWVRAEARAVTSYEGRFPVPEIALIVHVDSGNDIDHGVTYRGRRIEIHVGRDIAGDALAQDWELAHEMFHLALPMLDDDYDWMGEGFSDYLEPLARVRTGSMTRQEFWNQLQEGLPKGLPKKGDAGLDNSHAWGRMYWGGALYWFLADLRIREQTHNRRSLRDVARAYLSAGGNGRAEWEIDQILKVGDRATGTTVLKDLHDLMGDKPYTPDLSTLWRDLGIRNDAQGITFDEQAPLAAIRNAITAD